MVKDPMRKCSFCGHHGHNTRTCNSHGHGSSKGGHGAVKLFGVNISEQSGAADAMKKSRSMGNLAGACGHEMNEAAASSDHDSGYLSDGVIQNKRRKAAHERKKGTPWSEEEHRTFLAGLNDLGKGDWRGISTKYVPTRTPTQVASHAQKFFLRQQASNDRKKRRSSLFDMPYRRDEVVSQSYSLMKSATENPPMASGSQTLPGNSSEEILSRFPHLCLDNYHARVRPITPAAYNATNAQNYLPIPYTVGMGPNVQPWPMNMMMNYAPSYMYNATNNFTPIMASHPSGIPQPRSTPSSPSPIKRDGLDLKIGQPQPNQPAGSSSPSSGAISVT